MDEKPTREMEQKLYAQLIDQLQKYNTIVWQFPMTVFAANAFAFDKFQNNAWLILAAGVINISLAYAFQRLVAAQSAIIEATRKVEYALKDDFGIFIPVFKPVFVRAATGIIIVLWAMPFSLIMYALVQVFHQ